VLLNFRFGHPLSLIYPPEDYLDYLELTIDRLQGSGPTPTLCVNHPSKVLALSWKRIDCKAMAGGASMLFGRGGQPEEEEEEDEDEEEVMTTGRSGTF